MGYDSFCHCCQLSEQMSEGAFLQMFPQLSTLEAPYSPVMYIYISLWKEFKFHSLMLILRSCHEILPIVGSAVCHGFSIMSQCHSWHGELGVRCITRKWHNSFGTNQFKDKWNGLYQNTHDVYSLKVPTFDLVGIRSCFLFHSFSIFLHIFDQFKFVHITEFEITLIQFCLTMQVTLCVLWETIFWTIHIVHHFFFRNSQRVKMLRGRVFHTDTRYSGMMWMEVFMVPSRRLVCWRGGSKSDGNEMMMNSEEEEQKVWGIRWMRRNRKLGMRWSSSVLTFTGKLTFLGKPMSAQA